MVRARVLGLSKTKGNTGRPKHSGGYTFVEVMIVLAVSSLMFVAAMVALGGQQNETGFSVAMQDLNSKIQNYVSQVTAADSFDLSSYKCGTDSNGRPYLSPGSGSGGECIYLGIAIQAVPGGSTIYAYNVLGNRTTHNGSTDTGQLAETINSANPTPAMDSSGSLINMGSYNLESGAQVTKAAIAGSTGQEYDLAGIYNALPNDAITANTGGGGIVLKSYPFTSQKGSPQAGVAACLEETAGCTSGKLADGQEWDMCLQSADGKRDAEIRLTNSTNGLTSQLAIDHGCSI